MTLTDRPIVIPYLQSNVLANKPPSGWPSVPPTVRPLSWGQDHHTFSSDWDLVLGADIVYMSEVYPLLLDTLVYLCKKGATLYMSSKMRIEHGTPGFYRDSLPQMFHVVLVDHDPIQNINIYQAILKQSPEMTLHRARKLVNDC